MERYYLRQKRRLLRSHRQVATVAAEVLAARSGQPFAGEVCREAEGEFERLIPQIPYIGGRPNPFTRVLVRAASALAIYRVLKRCGLSVDEIGELATQIARAGLDRFPRFLLRGVGALYLSRFNRWRVRRNARVSQERRYPGDFVYQVVEGDSGRFAWGVDYLECGIVKFLHAQGADELTPYLCSLDYIIFPAMGIDLERRGTISGGCARCDFRFRRD